LAIDELIEPRSFSFTIKYLALAHPSGGCNRIEAMLGLEGIRVSSITIRKILQ
jgi:hypothetical protein